MGPTCSNWLTQLWGLADQERALTKPRGICKGLCKAPGDVRARAKRRQYRNARDPHILMPPLLRCPAEEAARKEGKGKAGRTPVCPPHAAWPCSLQASR